MGYNVILAKRALRGPWQCIDCKMCIVCEDAGDPVSTNKQRGENSCIMSVLTMSSDPLLQDQ
jgi:hypothetical protein